MTATASTKTAPPFDGIGIGRGWPLLTGERAHYELAAGRRDEAVRLLRTMSAFANEGGMFPEQIWDAPDIPEHELYFGHPAGSAMPLVWAHAEYLKLRRSLRDGRVFDMPPETVQRYLVEKVGSPFAVWRFDRPGQTIPAGKTLRLEVLAPAGSAGPPTTGEPTRRPPRATPGWASSSPTCRQRRWAADSKSISPLNGVRPDIGKVMISR